jgi:biopolymer transport protein ExbD
MSGGGGGEVQEEGSGGSVFGEDQAQSVDLNLTALMDILSNLLFFLLACFGATVVLGINATVPVSSNSKSDMADTSQTVTVGVGLSKDGYDVTALGTAQSQTDLDKWRRKIPVKDGSPDYAALSSHLLAIKQAYPKSDTMILTPEDGVSYAWMIRTMDAARENEVELAGLKRQIPVLPTVVVSTVVK